MQKLATSRDDLNHFFSINILIMLKKLEKIKQINYDKIIVLSKIVKGNNYLKNHALIIK